MKMSILKTGNFHTNCYIIKTSENNLVVIDPGDEGDKIKEIIDKTETKLAAILLTHAHHDHTGAVKYLKEIYPEAPVYMGREDEDMINNVYRNYACVRGKAMELFKDLRADILIDDGAEIKIDDLTFKAVATPGHTKGGMTYICEDNMFTGDTLFYESIGRSDLYGGNSETICQSVTKLMLMEGDYKVFPGHGPSSTLDYERQNNKYVRI